MSNAKIDIMIPTLNEAVHVREAVENARQIGDVFVLDSCSTDGTQAIAAEAGATVVEHEFEGYARQKNWGLRNLPLTGDWVFILDADERMTRSLRDEVQSIAARDVDMCGYFVNRQLVSMGKRIRHGGLYPSWNLRFFRRGCCYYEERLVHEHMVCEGPRGYLKHQMIHINLTTMEEYIHKHIVYADLEAEQWVKEKRGEARATDARRLFSASLGARQMLRRRVWPRMVGRPVLRFMYMYFCRFGFLDGSAGWRLAMLMASYEYMIGLLYRDKWIQGNSQEEPDPSSRPIE